MESFNANQKIKMAGRGDIFLLNIPLDDILPKIGENILVNGEVYQLLGIEGMNNLMSPPRRLSPVGFLVRKVEP
jgi:hypothetical protein